MATDPVLEEQVRETLAGMKQEIPAQSVRPSSITRRARRSAGASIGAGILIVAAVIAGSFALYRSAAMPFRGGRQADQAVSGGQAYRKAIHLSGGIIVTCLSPPQQGLISCQEAAQTAFDQGGMPGFSSIDARLSTYQASSGGLSTPAWDVVFRGVSLQGNGPGGGCTVVDWTAVVDATTGGWLVSGAGPGGTPCPISSP